MAELSWSVRLDDKMSSTAKTAAKNVGALGDSMDRLKKSANGLNAAGTKLTAFQKLAQAAGRSLVQMTGRAYGTKGVDALMSASRFLGKYGDGISAAWSKVGPVLASVGAAAASAAIALTALGLAAIGAALHGAMTFNETKAASLFAFEKILGSADKAAEAWSRVEAAAKRTKTPISEVAAAMNGLMAAGFNLKEAETLFKQLADLKTLSPQANIDGIVRAISQIKNIGKLQGDELMQLSEAGVNVSDVYDEIAKKLGKTKEEVLAMQKAGEIDAKTAIDAIQAAIAKKTGKAPGKVAGEAPKTAADTLKRLKEEFFNIVELDFGPLQSFLGKLEKALSGRGGAMLANSLERLFTALTKGLDSLSAEDITSILKVMSEAVDGVTKVVTTFTDAWNTVGGVLDAIGARGPVLEGFLKGLGAAFLGIVTGGLSSFISGIGGLNEAIAGIADAIGTWIEDFTEGANGLGAAIIDGIVAGVKNAAAKVAAAVKSACQSAIDAGKDVLDIGSPSKEFAKIGRWSMEGLAKGANDNAPRAGAAFGAAVGSAAATGAAAAQSVTNNTSNVNQSRNFSMRDVNVQGGRDTGNQVVRSLRSLNFAAA